MNKRHPCFYITVKFCLSVVDVVWGMSAVFIMYKRGLKLLPRGTPALFSMVYERVLTSRIEGDSIFQEINLLQDSKYLGEMI